MTCAQSKLDVFSGLFGVENSQYGPYPLGFCFVDNFPKYLNVQITTRNHPTFLALEVLRRKYNADRSSRRSRCNADHSAIFLPNCSTRSKAYLKTMIRALNSIVFTKPRYRRDHKIPRAHQTLDFPKNLINVASKVKV